MKIIDLLNIKAVIGAHLNDKLPFALSYKFYKLITEAEKAEKFYMDERKKIIEKYADKDSAGNIVMNTKGSFSVTEENKKFFENEVSELNSVPIDKPNIKFTVDELAPLSLSIIEVSVLNQFIMEEIHA